MKILVRVLACLSLAFGAVVTTQAQPSNDSFTNAWILSGTSVTTNGNNSTATKEDAEPFHAGNRGGRSVWFNWTAPLNGQVRIDTIGSSFNTLLAVYTGNAVNALTTIASNNDIGGGTNTSQVVFQAAQGTTYHIAVDANRNFGTPAGGNYILHLQVLASVNITSPTNGAVFQHGTSIPFTVSATVPGGSITRVELYSSFGIIGTNTTSPYNFTVINAPLGTNYFAALAYDNNGQAYQTPVMSVVVLDIGVTVTWPPDGASFLAGPPIQISVATLLPSGAMTNVGFYVDGAKIAEDTSSPFSTVWSNTVPGVHQLRATGKDNNGNSYNSASVFIAVASTFIQSNAVWKYLDNGTDQGTAWRAPGFDDSTWASGPAPLGYGDSNGRQPLTTNSFGPDSANKYITTYYRQAFVVTNAPNWTYLGMDIQRDDGAVVYLNGVEAARFNMPGGTVTSATLAAANAADDGGTTFSTNLNPGLLVEGTNVLAVEIHQDLVTSSDIWLVLDLYALPTIIRNQLPLAQLTNPTNNANFLAPASISLAANASDADGSVTNVAFFADGVKVGETNNTPYAAVWNNPPIGQHVLTAIAADDQGALGASAPVNITVYDSVGTPLIQITSPANGSVFQGPTNLTIDVTASAPNGVTNVLLLANGAAVGNDSTSPYSITWTNPPFATSILAAVAFDAQGRPGTSAPISVVVNSPPINTNPPVIFTQNPLAGATVTNLTSIQVTFSERVIGVDAADLLVNGATASTVSGSGSNYTFTIKQPAFGAVAITWATNHGITDIGYPSNLPFDQNGAGATWTYNLVDRTPPVIAARDPLAGSTLTNLAQISITFSKLVTGVDASDLLINGTPAFGLSGGGSNYTFNFNQPSPGTVNISWAVNHGITDQASPPNAFNASGQGATWQYILDNRTVLVQSNSLWFFLKAFSEASNPVDAWRPLGFNDSTWSNSLTPFFYGDTGYTNAANPGTFVGDMLGGSYSSIFLRKKFTVPNVGALTNLYLMAQSDDGFIAWINGVEVLRYNMPAGEIPYNGAASTAVTEPNNNGAAYISYTLSNPGAYLVNGTNELAIQAFNNAPATSSDFGFNAQLYTYLADPSVIPPRVANVSPAAGTLLYLTNIAVTFSEPVGNVFATNLLINGTAATGVTGGPSNTVYTFSFPTPAYGNVSITWAANAQITDFDPAPKLFDVNGAGATWQYTLLNPNAPVVASQNPLAGANVINTLTQVTVNFNKAVTGVDASDFLINGNLATNVSGGPSSYTFTFSPPPYGTVSIGWAASHGIKDTDQPPNDFDPLRSGNSWTYTLVDQIPPTIFALNPAAGATVTNLTRIAVRFTEAVTGVDATDLRINGIPATGVTGGPVTYAFTFPQPNATVVNVTWAPNHGIQDLATVPNPFNATGPGATWSYFTPDNLPPSALSIEPAPFATVRALSQIQVTFTEPVAGVSTNSLLINNSPARQLAGSGAGPYTFSFPSPSNGAVDVRWSATQAITDLASPPNHFAGGEWTYVLDPNASFAGKILINEIMFDPAGGAKSNEWIELRNTDSTLINLTGWRFTKGVDFTFPNVSIPPGGYLVVAANLAAFNARYPGVNNVIAGWNGSLANSAETLELTTVLGETVNSVTYASEGDWARRERGNGASPVISITRNGSTATVNVFGHGYTANDQIVITGADQPEYNGRFGLSSIGQSSFNITVSGTPASPATGNIVCHQVLDDGASGWAWYSPAAGFGPSLELVNPALPNSSGQNWLPSLASAGTPGSANSVLTNNVAPLIENVIHFPPVPKSTDSVAITARVRDELSNGVAGVSLFYRTHTSPSPGAFSSVSMLDDGASSDGVSGDGLYGVVLPAQASGTVVEFYVQATDTSGRIRTWPAPAYDTTGPNGTYGVPGQFANALYQVDNETIGNAMPTIRIVLTGTENAAFPPSNRNSDAAPNCTMISTDGDGTKIRYLCDTRIRGAGTRTRTPPNNRLGIPADNPWNGLSAINLNSQYPHVQLLGNTVSIKSGLPAEFARVVQYRINGVNPSPLTAPVNGNGNNGAGYGTFVLMEPPNGDLAADLFPLDGAGNYYRLSSGGHQGDFSYSTDVNTFLAKGYYKTSNRTENDWTDFENLTFAMSQITPNADYIQAVSTNLNVSEWMRYFAVCSLMNDGETKLGNGIGDDVAFYRGEVDKRFQLINHDFDTVFGQGDTGSGYYPINTNSSIFIMLNPPNGNGAPATLQTQLRRFMINPAFAPFFYAELKQLCDTTFHPTNFNPLVDQLLGDWGGIGPDVNTLTSIKNYAAGRRAVALSQIPLNLTINSSLSAQNGYLFTPTAGVTLFGTGNAIDTRKILVNGVQADWSAFNARWTNTVTLQPGINRVLVQSLNSNDVEFARGTIEIWYDDGSVQNVSGAIAADTVWSAANGPYNVTGTVTVNSGATLTIQPGTTVYLNSGVNITVANGGRILAEGTDSAHIRFTRAPGTAVNWGNITINGTVGSPETRIAYADFEFNVNNTGTPCLQVSAGTAFFDHLTFGNTAAPYIHVDGASFIIQNCAFPSATAQFELVHGTGGVKSGGHGLFLHNFFGAPVGYNDVVDFTGGNRPNQPLVQFLDNVFIGASDDILDLDGTDAWVEHNIFLHAHKNGAPDTSSAVSGGDDSGNSSEITVIGNIMYDCDQAAMGKAGNFYTLYNNTIVHQTHIGGTDTNGAIVAVADDGFGPAVGMYLEGNIIYDAENLLRFYTNQVITFTNNIITKLQGAPWTGLGGNNSTNDPLFVHVPALSETTNFTSWGQAQVMWSWLSLRTGSPATGTGPNGLDKGAVVHMGASISGEPAGTTALAKATLLVGINRSGNGIPAVPWPNGSGYVAYKWRLDGGPWSVEIPITNPIALSNLVSGPHYVEVTGKRDVGFYQDDASYGSEAVISVSRTWRVNPLGSPLRLSEILASNQSVSNHFGTTPDLLELVNPGTSALDLSGVGITDDPANPFKFIFPLNTTLAAGAYLTVLANNPDGSSGFHLGFNIPQSGGALYLYDSVEDGGALLDSVTFGLQLTDLSIGRLSDGSWALCVPTFGGPNRAASIGDPRVLWINEWLAFAQTPFNSGFVELYNPDPLPVSLGGLYLSDEPLGWPTRHQMPALTFMDGSSYLRLIADGDASAGADHLNFHVNGDQGSLAIYMPDLTVIDCVIYQPQLPNISQGRSPNGSSNIVFFTTPTPGAPNPLVIGPEPNGNALVINEVLAINATRAELDGRTPDWIEIYNGTTSTTNLADMSLTDSTLAPRKYVFPANTTLAPGAFLRVLCDPGATNPGPLITTNFALSGSGGAVYLFDALAKGGSLLNAIVYGIQTPDLSIGRVPNGSTNWVLTSPTPGAGNTAIPTLGDPANLKVNEWMADPGPGKDDWLEIYNPNSLPVALGGLYLSDDLNDRTRHRIAALSFIGNGTNAFLQFHADGNLGAGADHVSFSLKASGEAIGISGTDGSLIDGYAFGQQQLGVSQGRFPDGSSTVIAFPLTDSPGASNYRLLTSVVINEALTHTDQPLEDAVELFNLTGQQIDISGWWLSDDKGTLRKYQIPSPTLLPAHGFTVIYETHFTNRNEAAVPFALSSHGDEVVLSAAANNSLTGFRTSVKFGAAENAVSFGRYITSDGREEFVAMAAHTFGKDDPGTVQEFRTGTGATNTYPRVGPVVISEIMYHPPDMGTNDDVADEFIELHNITGSAVPLYDPAFPTNVWHLRNAVDFNFPTGTVLEVGGYLLVVSFDPVNNPGALAAFRAHYSLDSGVVIVGPYTGKLANDTDNIELRKPGVPDTNGVDYILVERVNYFDTAPWPPLADGTGFSLQRVSDTGFGNDATNWVAAQPGPGPQEIALDSDGDGMPDSWELANGFDPHNPADASLDPDGDLMTNLQEYQAGTDPHDAQSVLRLAGPSLAPSGTNMMLSFIAFADHTYSVQWKEAFNVGQWTKLVDVDAGGSTHPVIVIDPLPIASSRIYRLVTPQLSGPANPQPAILMSPKAIVTNLGSEASLSVYAVGAGPLSYQWRADDSALPNSSGADLSLTNVQLSNVAHYSVTVSDTHRAETSDQVTLSVPPRITVQLQDQLAHPGDTVLFSVGAEGEGTLKYQWRHDHRVIAGQTNATLILNNVRASDAGKYTVFVSHQLPWGRFSMGSSNAVLTVEP